LIPGAFGPNCIAWPPKDIPKDILRCGDLMKGCDFVATGATEDEVMTKTAEHAKASHGMHHLAPETALKLREAIREVQPTG
jgi:predicted small metal-binding protein